jgi:hypothetical protein
MKSSIFNLHVEPVEEIIDPSVSPHEKSPKLQYYTRTKWIECQNELNTHSTELIEKPLNFFPSMKSRGFQVSFFQDAKNKFEHHESHELCRGLENCST